MRCIEMTGSDDRMDCREMFWDPINLLPAQCQTCGFPDLDHVPQPYYLVKSRTMSPNELAPAENGNFFVRERIRRVLEVIAPGQCEFFPTCYKKTVEETPWSLAVPVHQVVTAQIPDSIPRCPTCGQPHSAHPGTQYSKWLWNRDSEYDVLKSSTWGSSESGWDKWITRSLFTSVRLFCLMKTIKARGLDEVTCNEVTSPNAEETVWTQERLVDIEQNGIPLHAAGTVSNLDAIWFRNHVKAHKRPEPVHDIKSLERQFKFKLPRSYVDFITKIGPATFSDVDEQEGFMAHIVAPEDMDTQSYRAGALHSEDPETNAVDGVMFARTEHGDCFCFDVQKSIKEYQVYLYKHDYNVLEPYAENFATCIKRFAEGRPR